MPYFLYVQQGASGPLQYVSVAGKVVLDPTQAQAFTISQSGQLMSGRSFFSTSGLVPYEAFAPRPYTAAISSIFSDQNNMLSWTSPSFATGQAQFCLMDTILEVAYDGYLPAGCNAVNVYLSSTTSVMSTVSLAATPILPASNIAMGMGTVVGSTPNITPTTPGSVHGRLAVGDPVGCLNSPSSAPALSSISETTSKLEQCVDYCASYSYFGAQNGR